MLVATCPKCGVPFWRGTLDNIPEEDVKCWICEKVSSVDTCDKYGPEEWRTVFLEDEKYVQARNIFHTNMRAVAEKMDLPTYFAEWGLITMVDLETGDKGEISKIFQEELKCLMENLISRLTVRLSEHASS
jgi:uncharacterized Zn finger protein (UPF0148 family)